MIELSAPAIRGSSAVSRAISVRENVVIKTQSPEASRRERLRTLAGLAVGEQTGLFTVPRIVSFDDARGEIIFERLHLSGLRQALSNRDRSFELVGRTAAALAAIHGLMDVGGEGRQTPAGALGISAERSLVPLHGDFGIFNVLFVADSDRMVVIDWANADWTGIDADIGAPEIDVAVFLISLFHRRAFGPWPIARRHDLARHFLVTYASAASKGLEVGCLNAIVAVIAPAHDRVTRRLRGNLRALGYRHGMIDLKLFLRRLSGLGFGVPRPVG